MTRALTALTAVPLTLLVLLASTPAQADDDVSTRLRGYEEVIFNAGIGAVSTKATGRFRARLHKDKDQAAIEYELRYGGLEGTVTQAHIHFGQRMTQGGISVFLCQTGGSPDPTGLAPTCPASPADGTVTVTGTLTPANVIGPAPQGIDAGELDELIRAIRAGVAYVNVHSSRFPGGEIRGQLRGDDDD
jgi:hypothetical protein